MLTKICVSAVAAVIVAAGTPTILCQNLAPVDISGFGNQRPLIASVDGAEVSECRVFSLTDPSAQHYDIQISGNIAFSNHSGKDVLLFKRFSVLTARMAATPEDINTGHFITGFDGDRVAISDQPKAVSSRDFVTIKPGKSYEGAFQAVIPVMPESQASVLVHKGRYWVQLGADARPDEFYFNPNKEEKFRHLLPNGSRMVDFVLTKPFPVDFKLSPATPPCRK